MQKKEGRNAARRPSVVTRIRAHPVRSRAIALHGDAEDDPVARPEAAVYRLRQEDFARGPAFLRRPGTYVLYEDVSFRPNPDSDHFPTDEQRAHYRPFALGFFAAIVVATSGVTLDLDGHTLEQSVEHSLQQRFYAHVCLGPSPFIPGAGPADFVSPAEYFAVTDVVIRNGKLGRSSHHGILGNDARSVTLRDLAIQDFEVAGIALNGGGRVRVERCTIGPSSRAIPLRSTYSAARFIRAFVERVARRDPSASLTVGGVPRNGATVLAELEARLARVFSEVVASGGTSDPLFRNPSGLNQGTQYGLVVHPHGPAIGGIYRGAPTVASVKLRDVRIRGLIADAEHVLGVTVPGGAVAQVDAAGAQIDVRRVTDAATGAYAPDELANAQLFVAKHGVGAAERGRTSIAPATVRWAEGAARTPYEDGCAPVGGGDLMFHVSKPSFGMRIEGVSGLSLRRCSISDVEQRGPFPSGDMAACGVPPKPHPGATSPGVRGPDAVGIGLASCARARLDRVTISGVRAWYGAASGIEQAFDAEVIEQREVSIAGIESGTKIVASPPVPASAPAAYASGPGS